MRILLRRSILTKLTSSNSWVKSLSLIALIGVLASGPLLSQSTNAGSSPSAYASISGGFGIIYGGFGGNAEFGYGHFAFNASTGYTTRRVVDNITIAPSVNWGLGLRYYFNVNSTAVYPRLGVGYGWITNYYNEAIGTASYDQSVYGLMLHAGTQVYSNEGIIFSFDLGMASKHAIARPFAHPHFYTFYLRPMIGVGFDLSRFWNKEDDSRIKNRSIDPFGA